jgi:hypothetical protein
MQWQHAKCAHLVAGLQVASFERNPLTGLPNYRQKVLQLLPKLENLDGQVHASVLLYTHSGMPDT